VLNQPDRVIANLLKNIPLPGTGKNAPRLVDRPGLEEELCFKELLQLVDNFKGSSVQKINNLQDALSELIAQHGEPPEKPYTKESEKLASAQFIISSAIDYLNGNATHPVSTKEAREILSQFLDKNILDESISVSTPELVDPVKKVKRQPFELQRIIKPAIVVALTLCAAQLAIPPALPKIWDGGYSPEKHSRFSQEYPRNSSLKDGPAEMTYSERINRDAPPQSSGSSSRPPILSLAILTAIIWRYFINPWLIKRNHLFRPRWEGNARMVFNPYLGKPQEKFGGKIETENEKLKNCLWITSVWDTSKVTRWTRLDKDYIRLKNIRSNILSPIAHFIINLSFLNRRQLFFIRRALTSTDFDSAGFSAGIFRLLLGRGVKKELVKNWEDLSLPKIDKPRGLDEADVTFHVPRWPGRVISLPVPENYQITAIELSSREKIQKSKLGTFRLISTRNGDIRYRVSPCVEVPSQIQIYDSEGYIGDDIIAGASCADRFEAGSALVERMIQDGYQRTYYPNYDLAQTLRPSIYIEIAEEQHRASHEGLGVIICNKLAAVGFPTPLLRGVRAQSGQFLLSEASVRPLTVDQETFDSIPIESKVMLGQAESDPAKRSWIFLRIIEDGPQALFSLLSKKILLAFIKADDKPIYHPTDLLTPIKSNCSLRAILQIKKIREAALSLLPEYTVKISQSERRKIEELANQDSTLLTEAVRRGLSERKWWRRSIAKIYNQLKDYPDEIFKFQEFKELFQRGKGIKDLLKFAADGSGLNHEYLEVALCGLETRSYLYRKLILPFKEEERKSCISYYILLTKEGFDEREALFLTRRMLRAYGGDSLIPLFAKILLVSNDIETLKEDYEFRSLFDKNGQPNELGAHAIRYELYNSWIFGLVDLSTLTRTVKLFAENGWDLDLVLDYRKLKSALKNHKIPEELFLESEIEWEHVPEIAEAIFAIKNSYTDRNNLAHAERLKSMCKLVSINESLTGRRVSDGVLINSPLAFGSLKGAYSESEINIKFGDTFVTIPLKDETKTRQIEEPTDIALSYVAPIGMTLEQFLKKHCIGKIFENGHGDEIDMIREYRHGDPLKIVNHKASARANKLMVTEYIQSEPSVVRALVDLNWLAFDTNEYSIGEHAELLMQFLWSARRTRTAIELRVYSSGDEVGKCTINSSVDIPSLVFQLLTIPRVESPSWIPKIRPNSHQTTVCFMGNGVEIGVLRRILGGQVAQVKPSVYWREENEQISV